MTEAEARNLKAGDRVACEKKARMGGGKFAADPFTATFKNQRNGFLWIVPDADWVEALDDPSDTNGLRVLRLEVHVDRRDVRLI